jgi:hypothetical protein
MGAAQCRYGWERVENIAHGAEADDENPQWIGIVGQDFIFS